MRHKLDTFDHGDVYNIDNETGKSSSHFQKHSSTVRGTPPEKSRNAADRRKQTRSVQFDDDDHERLPLRVRFAIIVGLSLLLWATLIGTAVALFT
jgi:hypothetical protein